MSDRNRKILVFGILIVTSIWGYFNIAGRQAKKAAQNYQNSASTSTPVVIAASEQNFMPEETVAQYQAEPWGVDPFYHAYSPRSVSRVSEEVTLHLLGILYRKMNAQVLINGQILKEGDSLEGYRIVKIAPDYVNLQSEQKELTLRVKKESS
ncbi:MAG: hypothetical protein GY841_08745 [FCB group bacterium]|nr:hypothetical protein [FCB group bacterium]